jgi:two-component system chemotaxis sensor kinase CheA
VELKDRLEQICATIGELHQAADEGPKRRQLLDSLFRSVHSFKAAASAEDFEDLSRIAHELEDLLHSLRTGNLTFDTQVLRALDETITALRSGLETNQPPTQTPSLERFNEFPRRRITDRVQLPAEFSVLKDDDRHRASEALREGSNLYVMDVVFEVGDFDERFRSLREQLNASGEVISTAAKLEDTDKIGFRILYAAPIEKTRMDTIFQQALRAGESAARQLGKQIEFVTRGDDLLLDRALCDALTDALLHLVRNAVDHGIESRGKVTMEGATESNGQLRITVTDDGRGIDPANLPLLFQAGFSTATNVTEFSGRGVGLDVVAAAIKEIGGQIRVISEPGTGASFEISLPNPSSDASYASS